MKPLDRDSAVSKQTSAGSSLVACSLLLIFPSAIAGQNAKVTQRPQANTSIYTDTAFEKCKTVELDRETGSRVKSCPGVAGYKLLVEDSDNRMSVTVVTPQGAKHPLNYWDVITPGFSSLGSKAEWRVAKKEGKVVPVALIVRVNAVEGPESRRSASYLAVAKITADGICVTDKIRPSKTANEEARAAADASSAKGCLERL